MQMWDFTNVTQQKGKVYTFYKVTTKWKKQPEYKMYKLCSLRVLWFHLGEVFEKGDLIYWFSHMKFKEQYYWVYLPHISMAMDYSMVCLFFSSLNSRIADKPSIYTLSFPHQSILYEMYTSFSVLLMVVQVVLFLGMSWS